MTEYRITKEQCETQIDGVCPGCGGEVVAIETVDNGHNPTFWSGCRECAVFTGGYPLEIFTMARMLVEEGTLRPYSMARGNTEDEIDYWLKVQTREASRIVHRIKRLLTGSLHAQGYQLAIDELRREDAVLEERFKQGVIEHPHHWDGWPYGHDFRKAAEHLERVDNLLGSAKVE